MDFYSNITKETMAQCLQNCLKNKKFESVRTLNNKPPSHIASLSKEQQKIEEDKFLNDMAFIYIKTFYGKSPKDFKTVEYKNESEKFNAFIEKSRNPAQLKTKIEQCLQKGSVDFINAELPVDLFYSRLKDKAIGLSTDDINHNIFIEQEFPAEARIYINPNMQNYEHFLTFLYAQSSQQELHIGVKTRMAKFNSDTNDNLIMYITAEDFPKVLQILQKYNDKFPDRVKDFGAVPATLCFTNNNWFGFGAGEQGYLGSKREFTTINSRVDDILENYALPLLFTHHFKEIQEFISNDKMVEIFTKAVGKDKAKVLIDILNQTGLRNDLYHKIEDLSYVKKTSEQITKDYTLNHPKSLIPNVHATQCRKWLDTEIELLNKQKIIITNIFSDENEEYIIKRQDFKSIFNSPEIWDAFQTLYKMYPEMFEQDCQAMMQYFNHANKNMPYYDENNPILSKILVYQLEKQGLLSKEKEMGREK